MSKSNKEPRKTGYRTRTHMVGDTENVWRDGNIDYTVYHYTCGTSVTHPGGHFDHTRIREHVTCEKCLASWDFIEDGIDAQFGEEQ